MKKTGFILALAALIGIAPLAFANGLNLNSLGTRALTMGGAFVALADDFSAVYWNPAGLAKFTSKAFGLYGTDILPSGTYKLTIPSSWPYLPLVSPGGPTPVDTKTQKKNYFGGMGTYIHPINEKLVAAISVYTPSGLGASWDGSQLAFVSGGNPGIDWMSKIGLLTIAPALAYKVNDRLSLGAALNVNYGMFDIKMHAGKADISPALLQFDLGQYEESDTGWGVGATFGIIYKATDTTSFGLTVRTPSTVSFSGTAKIANLPTLNLPGSSSVDRKVTWPLWIALGMSVHPSDKFTFNIDAQYTKWSTIDKLEADYQDTVWATLMATRATPYSEPKSVVPMRWGDGLQLRFGAEYMLTKALAIRAGYYSDPSPAPDGTLNILLPSFDFSVVTFGLGYSFGSLKIDAGIEYLSGAERDILFLRTFRHPQIPNPLFDYNYERAMPGTYNMKIVVPNISISYKF